MHLISTAIRLSIHRLPADADPPTPPAGPEFWSATRTRDEWSVVQSADEPAPVGAETSGPWRMLQVKGPLPHDAVGILASLAGTLAEAAVPLFTLSTFDTDYLLVPEALMAQAVAALRGAGLPLSSDDNCQPLRMAHPSKRITMPAISMFYGIIVYMYFVDNRRHHLPHIHARYQDDEAVVSIPDGVLLEGALPPAKMKLLMAWIELHRDELIANWRLAVSAQPLFKIQPLR